MNITIRPVNEDDPVIRAAIEELKGLIHKRFPTAQFQVYDGDDPHGIYLETTVDIEDITGRPLLFVHRAQALPVWSQQRRPAREPSGPPRVQRRAARCPPRIGPRAYLG
jgi:hypothetical protein